MDTPRAAPPPPSIRDLAEGCARLVHGKIGILPDFTPDTLPLVDHYLSLIAAELPAEARALIVPSAGAYFGEVVRLHCAGSPEWKLANEEWADYRIVFGDAALEFNPMGTVLEALDRKEAEGWAAHLELLDVDRAAVDDALGKMGEVRDEDYYRLALRYEVLEQVADLLVARTIARRASLN